MGHAEDLRTLTELYRAPIGRVDETLSPDDRMFDGEEHYRKVGESAIRTVRLALLMADRDPDSIGDILDLPCGHGRVLRYLKELFPSASFTACDTNRKAVDFCATTFGATPVHGAPDPEDVSFPGRYDLIFCGSLLTHLDEPMWTRFLARFRDLLKPGGLIVATTFGRQLPRQVAAGWDYGLGGDALRDLARGYRETGFSFVEYVAGRGYGIAAARPREQLRIVEGVPGLHVLAFREAAWDDHQDVLVLTTDHPEPPPGPRQTEVADVHFRD